MPEKPLLWVGSSLDELRAFPDDARREAGHELDLVQRGIRPSDSKPLAGVGPGVSEIRIHTRTELRVLYVAKFPEAVYVLHAFEKKSQKTRHLHLELARRRFGELMRTRSRGG